jgi:hypothetical protein
MFSGVAIAQIARRVQLALMAAAVLSSSACYTYAAVPTSQPLVEQSAEFRITDTGRIELVRPPWGEVLAAGAAVPRVRMTWFLKRASTR